MSTEVKKLHPLIPAQGSAVVPGDNIWLSASAGTGKTQVLTARVIRLLLENDVEPENLLCITFTKAGASEMADRINQLLASWVQLDDKLLFRDLEAIGADAGPGSRKKARQLFAKVLDAPGGGLQIMTIHSFCQSLLGSFPEEAGLVPGFKPIEGAEQDELLRAALANLVIDAEARGNVRMISDLQELSLNMGEEAAIRFLRRMAAAPDVMALIPDDAGAVVWARRVAGVSFTGPAETMLEAAFADEQIPRAALQSIVDANLLWCKNVADSRGGRRAATIQDWLSHSPAGRAMKLNDLHGCWSTSKGDPCVSSKGFTPITDAYAAQALELFQWTNQLLGDVMRAQYADRLARALTVGKEFSDQYAKAKHALGAVDFDDLIRRAADLLQHGHMADWVRFKLDRQIDHILVDEAQDTNAAQWKIVSALSDDFFSGMGVKPDKARTLFSVGDFKQAIYGFQGTAPERYEAAGTYFAERIAEAGLELNRLTLSQSFRSTAPILDFVNAVIEETGAENFGVSGEIEPHYSEKQQIGLVELLQPISVNADDNDQEASSDNEENWIGDEKRTLAKMLAEHARALIDAKPWLVSKNRPLEPGDIMFLLRSRGDMASMLVAQLHERNVPVAGVDRLRLLQPLVVQDLLAAIKFVLQPNDDFSLACVLVSPIIGWSQERLLQYGYAGDRKGSLWQHIRDREEIAEDMAALRDMLAMADFTTVYHFLEQILSGPIGARRKLIARLGSEVVVPIEEMLNAALQFEQQYGGGLQKFLGWFDRGESEIKREGDSNSKEVRIMTVHGAKGLQAPVVILADITSDPTKKPDQSVEFLLDTGQRVPLLPIRKTEQSGHLEEIITRQKVRELQEHKRLLYVAMTRAEERLIMAGSLGSSRKGEAPAESWYAFIQRGMLALGCAWEDDARWGRVMRYVGAEGESYTHEEVADGQAAQVDSPRAIPDWLFAPAPQEQNPPRPLVPSRLDDDDFGDAPASAAMRKAAMRGKLVHALFERITDHVSLEKAERWLAAQTPDADIDQAELLGQVRAIVQNENWAPFFGPSARAEIPLVAVVGQTVINGRIDRLLVEPGLVRAIDFKTGRHVPQDESAVPLAYLRQMAHYRAALQTIFPEHRIEVSLLFTFAPRLITLSDAILEPHYPAS